MKILTQRSIPSSWLRTYVILGVKQKHLQFLKHGKGEISYYGKSIRKHKHSKVMNSLNISVETDTCNPQPVGWMNSHVLGNVEENRENFLILRYLKRFELMRTHAISCFGSMQFSLNWKFSVERHKIPRLWVFKDIRIWNLNNLQGKGDAKTKYSRSMGFD